MKHKYFSFRILISVFIFFVFLAGFIVFYLNSETAEAYCPPPCIAPQPHVIKSAGELIKDLVKPVLMTGKDIATGIFNATKNMNTTNNVNTATIVKALESLQASNIRSVEAATKIKHDLQIQEELTGHGAQPESLIGGKTVAEGMQIANRVQKEFAEDMQKKQFDFIKSADKRPIDYLEYAIDENSPTLEEITDALQPANITLSEKGISNAQEAIKLMLMNVPPELPEKMQKEPSAQAYIASRKVYLMRQMIVNHIFNKRVAYHAPTLPESVTQWAYEQWKISNPDDKIKDMPYVEDGKLSQAGLFEILALQRTGNPNYSSELATLSTTGLMRELVNLQAARLELTRKNNELLDQLRVLTAISHLSELDGLDSQKLHDLYVQTIGTQQ